MPAGDPFFSCLIRRIGREFRKDLFVWRLLLYNGDEHLEKRRP